ncbi:MAG: ABC transporter permease [Pseudorhodoplanes sp.]
MLLILWEVSVVVFAVPKYMLPSPIAVFQALYNYAPMLAYHTGVTLFETVLAFVLCLVVGMPLAVAIASIRWIEKSIYPWLVVSQAVPKVAIAPLLLVWLGFGMETKIVVAVLVAFFPIVISMVVGLKSLPNEMRDLGRSMGLSSMDMFRKIRLPYALPATFGGIKVAATFAVVGAVIGEFVGADRGLGYLLLYSAGQLQTDIMFADVFILGVMGVALFGAVEWAERKLLPWHISIRNELVGT